MMKMTMMMTLMMMMMTSMMVMTMTTAMMMNALFFICRAGSNYSIKGKVKNFQSVTFNQYSFLILTRKTRQKNDEDDDDCGDDDN